MDNYNLKMGFVYESSHSSELIHVKIGNLTIMIKIN